MEKEKTQGPTIESIEYNIIKQVGLVVDFGKRAQANLEKMNNQIIELAKDAKPGTLDRVGLPHLKKPAK